jgi:multicomponent Na+:H+ antiporter subunit B
MLKKTLVFILIGTIGYVLAVTFREIPLGENRVGDLDNPKTVSAFYLDKSPNDLKVANTITAVVVNFRGFDTLGEVTVLFLAATGLASILWRKEDEEEEEDESIRHISHRLNLPSSSLVRTGAKILFPLILLLGIYVFIHGHLTPGGGFQGGAIIATGFLLMLVTYKGFQTNHKVMIWLESIAGLGFVAIGLYGLFTYGSFLQNTSWTGNLNDLISGGLIPLIYIFIGIKVATELTNVLDTLLNIKPRKK